MRPVIHSIARTTRCSCRQEVVGKAGDKASMMGKISGMGFRLLSCLGGTYNLAPKTLFSFTNSQFRLAKVLGRVSILSTVIDGKNDEFTAKKLIAARPTAPDWLEVARMLIAAG